MKGKKKDLEFVNQFIINCINDNKLSSNDILSEAKNQISLIDEKIKEVELLKKKRSKLLDVVDSFDNQDYHINNDLFLISNRKVSQFIYDCLSEKIVPLNSLYNKGYNSEDINFVIKQLVDKKIISKNGDYLLQGINFNKLR